MELQFDGLFNGTKFRAELKNLNIDLPDDKDAISISDGSLILKLDEKYRKTVEQALSNHDGTDITVELGINEKLASVGLNLDDLKVALGL